MTIPAIDHLITCPSTCSLVFYALVIFDYSDIFLNVVRVPSSTIYRHCTPGFRHQAHSKLIIPYLNPMPSGLRHFHYGKKFLIIYHMNASNNFVYLYQVPYQPPPLHENNPSPFPQLKHCIAGNILVNLLCNLSSLIMSFL